MSTAQSETGRLRTPVIGDAAEGQGQQGRRLGLALAVIATAQLMVVVGGAIGLGILGTVAWTVVADTARNSAAAAKAAAAAAARAGHPLHLTAAQAKAAQTGLYSHALATGFSRVFLVSAGIMVLALLVSIALIQVRRQDLAGVNPMAG